MSSKMWELMESSDRDALLALFESAISSYLDVLDDAGEVDAQDLAENIVIFLERDGHR